MTAHLLYTGIEKNEGRGLINNLMIFLYGNRGYDHSFLAYEISFCMFKKTKTIPPTSAHCTLAM